MARYLIVVAAFLSLAVPAALAAPPADKGKPEKNKPAKSESATTQGAADDKNAAKKCKAERTAMGVAAFKIAYGTNANKANAFGKCVSGKVKKDEEAAEAEQQAEENAAKKCKAERGTTSASIAAFKENHGTNKNKANAFGKCVSKLLKAPAS
jgi:hypothetical protein